MSIEVEAGKYFFFPDPDVSRVRFVPGTSWVQVARVTRKPFRYGMIHDLESLWWIAVWFLFHTHPIDTTYNPEALTVAGSIFSRHYTRQARGHMLRAESTWVSSVPVEFSSLAGLLDEFRLHYILMAKKTYEFLTPEGIAYKISIDHHAKTRRILSILSLTSLRVQRGHDDSELR
jgi:hypothetical protein